MKIENYVAGMFVCVVIAVATILILRIFVGGKQMNRIQKCEQSGGVYLNKDMVCARADGNGYITDY